MSVPSSRVLLARREAPIMRGWHLPQGAEYILWKPTLHTTSQNCCGTCWNNLRLIGSLWFLPSIIFFFFWKAAMRASLSTFSTYNARKWKNEKRDWRTATWINCLIHCFKNVCILFCMQFVFHVKLYKSLSWPQPSLSLTFIFSKFPVPSLKIHLIKIH